MKHMQVGTYFRPQMKQRSADPGTMVKGYIPLDGRVFKVTEVYPGSKGSIARYNATDGINEYKFLTRYWRFTPIPDVPCSGPHVHEDCLKCERLPDGAKRINEAMAGVYGAVTEEVK